MQDAATPAEQEKEEGERPAPNESAEPNLLDFAIARVTEDSNERQAMKAVAAELGIGDTTDVPSSDEFD